MYVHIPAKKPVTQKYNVAYLFFCIRKTNEVDNINMLLFDIIHIVPTSIILLYFMIITHLYTTYQVQDIVILNTYSCIDLFQTYDDLKERHIQLQPQ